MGISIIPYPNKTKIHADSVDFDSQWKISHKNIKVSLVNYFINYIETNFKLKIDKIEENSNLSLFKEVSLEILNVNQKNVPSNSENYWLDIVRNHISLRAYSERGIFYAMQTLFQIIFQAQIETSDHRQESSIAKVLLPQLKIEDSPRFTYRGFMLDVGRHFQPIPEIKDLIDIMAYYKFNKFHWHLTEDQGWRIEIDAFPKLTEIGSKRNDTQIGGFLSKKMRGKPHEGFYTKNEIREIISYAAERYIEVIPEIDIPGHSRAAIAAYPELSCQKQQLPVATKFGIHTTICCAGQDFTYFFLEKIFYEICELFPSNIIHIGGDEAPKKYWKTCPKCQQKIKEENLKDEYDLQVYFTNRIAHLLELKEKKFMVWNDILDPNLKESSYVQYWVRNQEKVKGALEKGHKVVNSHFFHYYLDYKYCLHPLRKVYNYEPLFSGLSPQASKNLIGIEAPLWTEWVPNRERLHWQVFPRLLAVAESAWTLPKNKNYRRFKGILKKHYPILHKMGFTPPPFDQIDPKGIKRLFQLFHVRKMSLV